MNSKDKKYIDKEIIEAKEYKTLFNKNNMINEYNFWTGYLNSLELLKLKSKHNYKI